MCLIVNLPRFTADEINTRLKGNGVGDAFQTFVYEVLLHDYPELHPFPTGGKDGAIDLCQTTDDHRVVLECKYVGADDPDAPAAVQAEWRKVAKHLKDHLADPNGPTRGQSQYSPWYRKAPAIEKYIFCTNSNTTTLSNGDKLKDKIAEFFQELSRQLPHLSHLSSLKVEVLDWTDFSRKTLAQPHLVFRWFPNMRPKGFIPLDEPHDTSFGAFLQSENLSYYSRHEHMTHFPFLKGTTIQDEDSLLDRLKTDDVSGLIITGRAGVGKTRLMLELGHGAKTRGWIVLRVLRGGMERDALHHLADQVGTDTTVLLLFDYIETRADFAVLVEDLLTLNQTYHYSLRYLASCRNSHYRAVQKIERHERVNLSPPEVPSKQEWLRNYQRETVKRVLEQSGLPLSEACIALCHDTPVLAVFLAYLQKSGRETDLAKLLQERDFGQWLTGRLAHHSSEAPQELAMLAALFPLQHSVAVKNPNHNALFQWLEQDGWIEYVDLEETRCWRTIHDVFADRILLNHVGDLGVAGELFFYELFRVAAEYQSVPSAIFSVQRVCDQPPLCNMNWQEIFESSINKNRAAWLSARLAVLYSDILTLHGRVCLLGRCKSLWAGAENEPEFHNAVGWIIRRLADAQEPPLDSELRAVLCFWIAKVLPLVDKSNFILTWSLRYVPELARKPAIQWIQSRPRLLSTRFLIVAWLECGLPRHDIQEAFVKWLSAHDLDFVSDFAMGAWLTAGGEKEIVRQHLSNWLSKHGATIQASFIFQTWLKAGGERTFVQSAIQNWLKIHSSHENAHFTSTAWLNAGGELSFVRETMLFWFHNHTTDPASQFEYHAWLDGGGSKQEVVPFISRWLAANQTIFEARFVYKSWLEAGGDKSLVRLSIQNWLKIHGLTHEASFVYPAWLKAGGEVDLVSGYLKDWFKFHAKNEDASYIYELWLVRGGDKSLVCPHISGWLATHGETSQARFVYKAWLEKGGEFLLIESSVLRWMEKNQANADSIFITRLISREKQLSDQTLKRLLAWTGTLPEKDKCVTSFSKLGKHLVTPSLRKEIVGAAEQLLTPLLNSGTHMNGFVQGDIAIVISYLLSLTHGQTDSIRERVDSLFLIWLRHPGALTAEMKPCDNIQRVEWLGRVGDLLESQRLNTDRDRPVLEHFLCWVDSWEAFRKSKTASTIEFLKRRFHAPNLWNLVHLHPQFHQQPSRGRRHETHKRFSQ